MGNFRHLIGGALLIAAQVASFIPVSRAATVIGQPKFTDYSSHRQAEINARQTKAAQSQYSTHRQADFSFLNTAIPSVCGADPAKPAVYDGAPGAPALFCNITGGRRTVLYNSEGTSPSELSPFGVHLFEGSAEVTPMYWSWYTGGASNRIYGTGIEATFTPSVKPVFSTISSNNYVQVMTTYSSLYGRRRAVCGVPVAVTKGGERGFRGYSGHSPVLTWSGDQLAIDGSITGPHLTGPSGDVTEAQVLALLAAPDADIVTLQGGTDSDVKLQLLYASTGGTSLWVTSSGLLFMKDTAGKITWGWDNTNQLMTFSNYSYSSARKNMTIDRRGQVKQYAPNGTTLIYATYTTGRVKRWNRTTGLLAEHIEPDGKRTLYRPDGVTPQMQNYTSGAMVL